MVDTKIDSCTHFADQTREVFQAVAIASICVKLEKLFKIDATQRLKSD